MRTSTAALALIQRTGADGATETLVQWSDSWRMYSLVGGHVEPGETFRECCVREVGEELGLAPDLDFVVAVSPVRPMQEYEAFSHGAGEQTRYRVALFAVRIVSEEAWMKVSAHPDNRWLKGDEISRKITADGFPVSDQVETVLRMFGVL